MSSISAEDIKAGRERKMMTQQELADEVGVSLRTVSSWERGESVPRNRTAVIAEVLGLEGAREFGREALLRRLGQLAKRRREELGIGRQPFAREAGLGSDKTLVEFEFGRVLPSGTSQRKIEKALEWRIGVIDDMMRMLDRKAATIEMEELDAEDSLYLDAQGGVKSLALISNDDLLEELRRRLSQVPAPLQNKDMQNMFGLAASTNVEHLEEEED
jgi:DNA-binding transcriptional regulator YiaG